MLAMSLKASSSGFGHDSPALGAKKHNASLASCLQSVHYSFVSRVSQLRRVRTEGHSFCCVEQSLNPTGQKCAGSNQSSAQPCSARLHSIQTAGSRSHFMKAL